MFPSLNPFLSPHVSISFSFFITSSLHPFLCFQPFFFLFTHPSRIFCPFITLCSIPRSNFSSAHPFLLPLPSMRLSFHPLSFPLSPFHVLFSIPPSPFCLLIRLLRAVFSSFFSFSPSRPFSFFHASLLIYDLISPPFFYSPIPPFLSVLSSPCHPFLIFIFHSLSILRPLFNLPFLMTSSLRPLQCFHPFFIFLLPFQSFHLLLFLCFFFFFIPAFLAFLISHLPILF